jgi:hypothetical protein
MLHLRQELIDKFAAAVASLENHFVDRGRLDDANAEVELRGWLDGGETPLPWAGPGVTPDEWFFVTTLYGQETRDQQRTHIRRYFPPFAQLASGDIREISPTMVGSWILRGDWMKGRLCRMARILRGRGMAMTDYVEHLRRLEAAATPHNPMPALDAIIRDHRATGWKTLGVFVRDCVRGNCFPIDSRVRNELRCRGLPAEEGDEPLLVRLSLNLGENPRQVARMFYEAGGEGGNFCTTSSHPSRATGSQVSHGATSMNTRRPSTALDVRQEPELSPSRRSSMVRELSSLNGEASGYILNLFGGPTGRIGNIVHPYDCSHLRLMKIPPRKIWGSSVKELEEWVKAHGGQLDPNTPTCRNV